MKWLVIGGIGVVALLAMRSRAEYPEPPDAFPAPPLPPGTEVDIPVEEEQVVITTPEGDTWEATMEGAYYQVVD